MSLCVCVELPNSISLKGFQINKVSVYKIMEIVLRCQYAKLTSICLSQRTLQLNIRVVYYYATY